MESADCRIERLEGETDLKLYLRDYRDVETFMGCCRECGSFMKRWHCPPLAPDFEIDFDKYATIRVVGYKIIPEHPDSPGDARSLLIAPARQLGSELLHLEQQLKGRAIGLAQLDNCFCHEGCTRPVGMPCRHPELVRPALEAYGFDVGKTARDILGLDLLWSKEGRLPDYLTLVGAVVY